MGIRQLLEGSLVLQVSRDCLQFRIINQSLPTPDLRLIFVKDHTFCACNNDGP